MSNTAARFETREAINAAILRLVEAGVPLDDVDVALSRINAEDGAGTLTLDSPRGAGGGSGFALAGQPRRLV